MNEMISFRVVKEPYGWAVRMGKGMMTPFRSRVLAISPGQTTQADGARSAEISTISAQTSTPNSGQ